MPYIKLYQNSIFISAFIGEAGSLDAIFKDYLDEDNIQDLMTQAYAKKTLNKKYSIKVDSTCRLFQNLNGATGLLHVLSAVTFKDVYIYIYTVSIFDRTYCTVL